MSVPLDVVTQRLMIQDGIVYKRVYGGGIGIDVILSPLTGSSLQFLARCNKENLRNGGNQRTV